MIVPFLPRKQLLLREEDSKTEFKIFKVVFFLLLNKIFKVGCDRNNWTSRFDVLFKVIFRYYPDLNQITVGPNNLSIVGQYILNFLAMMSLICN